MLEHKAASTCFICLPNNDGILRDKDDREWKIPGIFLPELKPAHQCVGVAQFKDIKNQRYDMSPDKTFH